ncbi:ABC transporter substrate-binding protein [Caldisericum exile]|uniref:ABC transporter substrate binding protein n=1 Tax=Caldisericum exile (strain DSM 21853 / NBRC 104410 / AZM16c01) TaxID=511051 RepID=A0A7U6GD62_CALEA|nr:ABC transporter substrate-binding protein [Caldisericum exile]BAL80161.1 ABC transporter substrate binding protein [Caldisericum exile AZM16c01]
MKRLFSLILVVVLIFTLFPKMQIKGASYVPMGTFEFKGGSNTFKIDSFEKKIDVAPVLKGDTLFVPIRTVIEELGGTISYNPRDKSIPITLNDIKVTLWLNKSEAVLNGKSVNIEMPILKNGRTLVSQKDIVNLFGGSLNSNSIEIPKQLIVAYDTTGRKIIVPKKINKIVSLYPMATLLLFPLNMQDKISAMPSAKVLNMDNFSKVFPKAKNVPNGGDYRNPNVETILSFKPDLVITNATTPINKLVEAGIPVALLDVESVSGILKSTQFLGTILGKDADAKKVLVYINSKLQYIESKTKYLQNKKKVYFALGKLTQTAGSTLIQNEIIARSGGISVTSTLKGGKVDVSVEQILNYNPDYIILAPYCSDTVQSVLSNSVLQNVNAVRNKKVFVMPQFIGSYDLPELESVLGIMWLSNVLYPNEVNFNLRNESKEFYDKIFNYNLTDEDLKYIFGS